MADGASPRERPDSNLVRNERLKLTATFLNNVAIAVIGASFIAPFFAVLYGLGTVEAAQLRTFAIAAPTWLLIGVGIHMAARAILGLLQE